MKDLELPKQYTLILDKIAEALPLAQIDTENFNKSSSQFKTAILDVSDLTPINSARHLLASIQRTRQALEEASVNLRRKKLALARKQRDLLTAQGDDIDEIVIDIDELQTQIANIEAAGKGAVRKLANGLDQYQTILAALGKTHLTEMDYELDQVRFHIMTAFNQALTAARSRGGLIDEGNHIYLFQLGINGALAQWEITSLLEAEQNALNQGLEPSHEALIEWLNRLADKYAHAPEQYAQIRNLNLLNTNLILENNK